MCIRLGRACRKGNAMMDFCQGDIIRFTGFKNKFIIVSKNTFIRATHVLHVCPVIEDYPAGPVHICVEGKEREKGTVICEQVKLIDPSARGCSRIDRVPYDMIMDVSDALQGIFEYD